MVFGNDGDGNGNGNGDKNGGIFDGGQTMAKGHDVQCAWWEQIIKMPTIRKKRQLFFFLSNEGYL